MLKILKIREADYKQIFILSDVHANNKLLKFLLEKLEYGKEDLFIFLGDSWDRGNEVEETFDTLMGLQKKSNLIHLKGNHEKMMEDYFCFEIENPYLLEQNGAKPTIEVLKKDQELLNKILDFINAMPNIVESEFNIFVHAGLDLTKNLDSQDEYYTLWTKDKFWQRNSNQKKTIFYGHVIQPYGLINVHEHFNAIGMDCGSYKFKRMGCYELKTKKKVYVSED